MGVTFDREKIPGGFSPFWRGGFKVLPGGFKLKQTFPEGTLLRKSIPLQLDFDNLEAGVVKVAEVLAGGTATKPRVVKGSLLQVGDTVMVLGKTDASTTVKSLDKTNSEYDVIELTASLGALAEKSFLQESSEYTAAAGENPAVPAAPLYIADAVIETDVEYSAKGFQTVSAGYEGLILKEVAYPIPSDWLNGYSLKGNPSIKYIRQ